MEKKSQQKLTDYLAEFLDKKGINSVFELTGGMITHILDSISQRKNIQIISMHHEQAAAFAADAFGRIRNIPGIAFATSGPGATNLLTGIGSCYFDSVPALFITGQVNTHEQKGSRKIRQLGFQETDIVAMAKPITKAAFQVSHAEDFPQILEEAYQISITGRPGPVLIDIPMNIQRAFITPDIINPKVDTQLSSPIDFDSIFNLLIKAQKPLIIAGRGLHASSSTQLFAEILKKLNIPVCQSLLGLDSLSSEHPMRIGFMGSYGNRWVNKAIADSDLLFILGARLDIRQTGADTKFFSNRTIIHVDCEEGELNNRIESTLTVCAELHGFLSSFLNFLVNKKKLEFTNWHKQILKNKEEMSDLNEIVSINKEHINPNYFISELSKCNQDFSYTADVGAHQMWAAQSVQLKHSQHFITSGGMGAMGYALPAAIGGYFALDKGFIAIIGDGSMQLNIQELQTIVRCKIPIKIIVMNNQSLGMIRQFQDSYFESRYQSTVWGYSAPDFSKVATAYGISSLTISKKSEIETALDWLFIKSDQSQPSLLQVMIDPKTNVYPKIAFGRPLHEMEPTYAPQDMEGT